MTFEGLVRLISLWPCKYFIIIPGTLFYILRVGVYCVFIHVVSTFMPKRILWVYQTSHENNASYQVALLLFFPIFQ